jgi:hypothetical protein
MINELQALAYREHFRALLEPEGTEVPMVKILEALPLLVAQYGKDHVLREGVALILCGTQRLLIGDRGRLDGGLMDEAIHSYARKIHFDMDREEFE